MTHGFTDRSIFNDGTPESRRPVTLVLELMDTRRVKAVLVRDKAGATAWLPREMIVIAPGTRGPFRVTMPTWLALDRGLATKAEGQETLF